MKSLILLCLLSASSIEYGSCQGDSNAYFFINNITSGHVVPVTNQETIVVSSQANVNRSVDFVNNSTDRTLIPNLCSTGYVPCHANANCDDSFSDSAAQCTCQSGYNDTSTTSYPGETVQVIPAGTSCTEIDECLNVTVCGAQTFNCTNLPGTYTCECNTGYALSVSKTCEDIDECPTGVNTSNCDGNATCTNTNGNFTCACNSGFTGDGFTCAEIDECTALSRDCGANGTCVNSVGSYFCNCDTGYVANGTTDPIVCVEIDECTTLSRDCGANGTCVNTAGSYFCNCDTGYVANGTTDPIVCVDQDECNPGNNTCHATWASCTNTNGSFTCACNAGFTGDGMNCTDINECAGTHGCHANARCSNADGSFSCSCNTGFTGNGTFCMPTTTVPIVSTTMLEYRALFTVEVAVNETTAKIQSTIEALIADIQSNTSFSYTSLNATVESLTVNGSRTEIIAVININGSSHSADNFTTFLETHSSPQTINGGVPKAGDYDECATNYGNCSTAAICTNFNGTFSCVCNTSYADVSTTPDLNGTNCVLPVNFTCYTDRVEVWALGSFFMDNHQVSTASFLKLNTCSGTDDSSEYWKFNGSCGGVPSDDGNNVKISWNLTNDDPTALYTTGVVITYPITCVYQKSQNISFDFNVTKSVVNGPDQQTPLSEPVKFQAEPFADASLASSLNGPIGTGETITFRVGPTTSLPNDIKIRIKTVAVSAAEDTTNSITLMDNYCPATPTSATLAIMNTFEVVRNSQSSHAIIRLQSFFFGSSRTSRVAFVVELCVETGGTSCVACSASGRRRRSAIMIKVKREVEQTGEATAFFQRKEEDVCSKDCGEVGICVLDAARAEQCVCGDGAFKDAAGRCQVTRVVGNEPSTEEDRTVLWIIIGLAVVMFVLVAILIAVFAFKRSQSHGKDYDLSYVNSNAITK